MTAVSCSVMLWCHMAMLCSVCVVCWCELIGNDKLVQVGNAVTDGRHIVVGMGSSMLINAALYAFSNASRTPGGTPPCTPPCTLSKTYSQVWRIKLSLAYDMTNVCIQ